MTKFVLAICALLVLLISGLTAQAVDKFGNINFDSCGLFCDPSLASPQSSKRVWHRRKLRSVAHAHSKHAHQRDRQQASIDEMLAAKELSNDKLNATSHPDTPTDPVVQANSDLEAAPVDLESLIDLARRLTAESKRAATRGSTAGSATDDPRIALLITKGAVLTISELAGKSIAIDSNLSESDAAIRVALVAAGAPEIQISEDRSKPLSKMLRDEVPGAVIGLVLPDRLHDIPPQVEGYRVFQVPLSPS
jgi:hypothetical protein